jgi:NADH-quinone oxidoreductase subunit A
MLAEYFRSWFLSPFLALMGVALLATGGLLGPRRPDSEKLSPYECGFEAFEDTRTQFDVRYYLVAILFIIFDLEIAFFIPWALAWTRISGYDGGHRDGDFRGRFVIGFFYIWKKGALEWE